MRFFLFCTVVFLVAGCRINNFHRQEQLFNFMINPSGSNAESYVDNGVKQHAVEFFATYFTEEELQDFIDVTSKPKYRELQQEFSQKQTMEARKQLADFILQNAQTDFFRKINSVDFRNQYKKHFDAYLR